MLRQLLSIIGCLFLPTTWRNPYRDAPPIDPARFADLPRGEAPLRLPHDHIWPDGLN